MRARIRLVLDYAYNGNTYEEGEHLKHTVVEWLNAPNERNALIEWIDWKHKMEKFYLVENTVFPNEDVTNALKELVNSVPWCGTPIDATTVCVRAFEHTGAHSAAEQARGK